MSAPTADRIRIGVDRGLFDRARARDAAAIAEIYAGCYDYLYKYAYHRLDRNHPLAEDCVQATWSRLLPHIDRVEWRGPGSIVRFLTVIARNLINDYYKSGRRKFERIYEDLVDLVDETPDPAPDPADVAAAADASARMLDLLRQLASQEPRQAYLLCARYFDDTQISEVAAKLGCSENAVAALRHRALRRLRLAVLAQEGAR